jgi:hypothetical protein
MTEENEVGKPMQLRRLLPLKHQLSSLESEVTEVGACISFVFRPTFLLLHVAHLQRCKLALRNDAFVALIEWA